MINPAYNIISNRAAINPEEQQLSETTRALSVGRTILPSVGEKFTTNFFDNVEVRPSSLLNVRIQYT